MEPLCWLSRTFSKRDCAVGWDHLSDCFSSFINGFSFSCLPDSQKGIFYCKPSPSLCALQQRKGKELNNCSQPLFVYQEPLSPKSKHFMRHTDTQFSFAFSWKFWCMCNLKAFSYVGLHLSLDNVFFKEYTMWNKYLLCWWDDKIKGFCAYFAAHGSGQTASHK